MASLRNPFHPNKIWLHSEKLEQLGASQMVAPVTLAVDLTDNTCNQNCYYCSFDSGTKATMRQIDADALLRASRELYSMGTKGVQICGGGEPTAHPKVKEIVEGMIDIGLQVGIITNGVLLNSLSPIADRMTYIRVSLDSAIKETYEILHGAKGTNHFEKVIGNMKSFRKIINSDCGGLKLGIGYLVVPPFNHTKREVFSAVDLANEIGVDYIVFRPANLNERFDKEWDEALDNVNCATKEYQGTNTQIINIGLDRWKNIELDNRPKGQCLSRPLVLVVQADGSIPECHLKRDEPIDKLGNIYTQSINEIWFGQKHLKSWQDSNIDTCRLCKHYRYIRAIDQLKNGDIVSVNEEEITHPNQV